jgi:hypothetical protein
MSNELLVLTSQIAATMTNMMSGTMMTAAMIDATIIVTTVMITMTGVVIGKTTLGGGRTTTTQWTTPSTLLNQGPSMTMKTSTPRSSRVPI